MRLNFTLFRPASLLLGMSLIVSTVSATDVPKNLGNGADSLVESNIALKKAKGSRTNVVTYNGFATEKAANYAGMAIKDPASNRYIVDIHPNSRVPFEKLKETLLKKAPSLQIIAVDKKYRGVGVIEGYVSVDDMATIASVKGVTSVQLAIKPYLKRSKTDLAPRVVSALTLVGTAFDQGVTQHRVDKVSTLYNPGASMSLDGNTISVGALSDSFGNAASSGSNLPGGSSPYNTTPVAVLQDDAPASDEGRAMCEIIYKMAPRAKIGFATANLGEVSFANNIRALAGLTGFTYPNQTFAAQAICDDVGYFDEPWFEDGIIGEGIDDVNAAGVSYFSSAGNDIGTNGYTAPLRWVPNGTGLTAGAGNTALAGTNIDLTGVPAALYAGGFHNFNPKPGQRDIAQTWAIPSGGQLFVVQWDDPFDQNTQAILDGPALYSNNGTINSSTPVTFTNIPALTAGNLYEIDCFATSGNLDVTVTVFDPSNNVVVSQDNAIDEVVHFRAPVSGTGYKITIGRFGGTGSFHIDLYHATGYVEGQLPTTDINLLAFRVDTGAYIPDSSLITDNFATNQPLELGTVTRPAGQGGVQFVLVRTSVPPNSPTPASHVRMADPGNGIGGISAVEYLTYDTVTTGGHSTAKGCNGTAAYSVFRPSRPETFTSPGPAIYYFDKNNNRLATPEVRLQPRVAAADNGNTSFFAGDSAADGDTNQNFSGTSAAAPHAAAIAALVLQAKGGPGTVTPAQMTNLLQNTAFTHDLDPMFIRGTASASGGTVNITVNSDSSNIVLPAGTSPAITSGGVGLQDNTSWKVSYSGTGFLKSLTFNPAGTAAAAGNPTGGNNGVDQTNTYFSNRYPGVVFEPASKAFTLGTLSGLTAGDITVPLSTGPFTGFSNLAPPPSNGVSHFWTMAIGFPTSNFTNGRSFTFTVGRGQQHTAAVGTFAAPLGGAPFAGPNSGITNLDPSADLIGGAVLIPEGTVFSSGMAFSGTLSDGVNMFPFNGTMNSQLGSGYSVLDGYGFINAEAAAGGTPSTPGPVTLSSAASRKIHGAAGTFNIPMPLAGTPGVECRDGGANGDYTLVFTFANPLTSAGGAIVTAGNGSVSSTSVSGNSLIVNLTNVTTAQRVTVNALDVRDNAGKVSDSVPVTMRVIVGDTGASGSVTGTDVSQTKVQVGAVVGAGNFREDVLANGNINGTDVSAVKVHSGQGVP